MEKKEIILYLYFDQHLKQEQVAYGANASQQYVSKIIKKDERYIAEKDSRMSANAEKRKIYQQEYQKSYKRPSKDDDIYQNMLLKQRQHSIEMSRSRFNISDYTYSKWNASVYHSNGKGNLLLDKKIKTSKDIPKTVHLNLLPSCHIASK